MARTILAVDRIRKARELIDEARRVPPPEGLGKNDLSYIAKVKDLLNQARDLVKFIRQTPSASEAIKDDVKKVYEELETADREILKLSG